MKNQLTIISLVTLFLPGLASAQAARTAVLAAETSFASEVSKNGMKTAFLTNAAPSARVVENGKLVEAQELWNGRPARSASTIAWYPLLTAVSQTGDFAYTTGPWTMLQNERPQGTGEYVTVWRKQPDGQWKYAVNMNIERIGTAPAMPADVPRPHLAAATATPSAAPTNILLDLDRKFAAAELLKPGATYQQYLSTEARLYRPGLSTMQGLAAAANMKNLDGGYLFTPTTGYLAAAGDLGYVVGTLRRAAAGTKHPEENGTYLRIWRREAEAGWRLVVEMFNYVPTAASTAAVPAAAAEAQPGAIAPGRSGQ